MQCEVSNNRRKYEDGQVVAVNFQNKHSIGEINDLLYAKLFTKGWGQHNSYCDGWQDNVLWVSRQWFAFASAHRSSIMLEFATQILLRLPPVNDEQYNISEWKEDSKARLIRWKNLLILVMVTIKERGEDTDGILQNHKIHPQPHNNSATVPHTRYSLRRCDHCACIGLHSRLTTTIRTTTVYLTNRRSTLMMPVIVK